MRPESLKVWRKKWKIEPENRDCFLLIVDLKSCLAPSINKNEINHCFFKNSLIELFGYAI